MRLLEKTLAQLKMLHVISKEQGEMILVPTTTTTRGVVLVTCTF